MKTPNEIKKGLDHCGEDGCKDCPYVQDCTMTDGFSELAKDSLAYIQKLEAENAQQARCIENLTDKLNATNDALPRWISVEERLPEDDVDVIVYAVSNNGGCTIVITFHTHALYGLNNIEGWAPPWQYFSRNYTITHWMPLPEPPKEEHK